MSSLKQLIINAIIKVSAMNPAVDREDGPTAEEARDEFIRLIVAELFPEESASVTIPVVAPPQPPTPMDIVEDVTASMKSLAVTPPVPASPVTKERKRRAPMSEEAKNAMKAKRQATLAARKSGATSPAPEPKVEEPKVESKPEPKAEEPKPEAKEKKPRKAKTPATANLPKVDPTWKKHLKKATDNKVTKEIENELLKFVNAMDSTAFNNVGAEEHVKNFMELRSKPAEESEKVDAELDVVEFNGKEYYVNPETKRVYEGEGEYDKETGGWTSYKGVGYAGMAAFADMMVD